MVNAVPSPPPPVVAPSDFAALRAAADRKFPAGKFVKLRDVVVAIPHRGTSQKTGRPIEMGVPELQAMAANCNRRIQRSGDYSMLTIGHTSPDLPAGPPVVGYAGPFRLEKVRLSDEPGAAEQYAIVCDWHVFAEDAALLKRYPRRSPELWLTPNPHDRWMDPIALLGAQTPRLNMGLRTAAEPYRLLYTARHGAAVIEKYAAAGPSASAVFIPGGASAAKPRGAEKMAAGTGSQDLITDLVNALNELDWVKWVKAKMEEESGSNPAVPPAGDVVPPPTPAAAVPDPTLEPDNTEKMQAGSLQKYQAMVSDMGRDMVELKMQVQHERALRVNSERRAALGERAHQVEMDLPKELERCSASRMSDEQFRDHLSIIDTHYAKLPTGRSLEQVLDGAEPYAAGAGHAKSRALSDRAMKICDQMIAAGKPKPNYFEILEQVTAGKL